MSLAALRIELQRALKAGIDGMDRLYSTSEKLAFTKEELEFCSRTTELVLQAYERVAKAQKSAHKAEPPPKPKPIPQPPRKQEDKRAIRQILGIQGRPAKEILQAEPEEEPSVVVDDADAQQVEDESEEVVN